MRRQGSEHTWIPKAAAFRFAIALLFLLAAPSFSDPSVLDCCTPLSPYMCGSLCTGCGICVDGGGGYDVPAVPCAPCLAG